MEILKGTWHETQKGLAVGNDRLFYKDSINVAITETHIHDEVDFYGEHADDLILHPFHTLL